MKKCEISIILPVFNEEESIREVYRKLVDVITNELKMTYEIIFVDDGSIDNSWSIIEDLHKLNRNVRSIKFSRNFGHQISVTAGIDKAIGDVAVIMDADLQDPPELIPEMFEKHKQGYNVVYAKRIERKGESKFKIWTSLIYYRMLDKLTEIKIPLDTGDFRLIDKKVLNEFHRIREKNPFVRGIISWIGFKQTSVEYVRDGRYAGTTKYPLSKLIKLSLDGITSFSVKPLKISLNLGLLSVLFSIATALFVFIKKLLYPVTTVPGWASTVIVIVFFAGIQLFTLGIIGEYIGRIFDESKNRPLYIIEEELNYKN